jgi:hypothetical protein
MGPTGQAVVDGLLARVPGLEFCEHDPDGFAMWIATRPSRLLCGFCYQAAQVLAENVVCAVLATSLFGDVAAALGEHGSATLDEHCCYLRRPD